MVGRDLPVLTPDSSLQSARRIVAALLLTALAVVMPLSAEPVIGAAGATVGAVLVAAVVLAVAAAVWPWTLRAAEAEHRRLQAIWCAARNDARAAVPWDRYLAWAEPADQAVSLQLLRCAPAGGEQPSPYSRREQKRFDAEDAPGAVEAMEALRAHAAELELRAAQRYEDHVSRDDQRAHEERLAAIDRATEEEIRSRLDHERRAFDEQEAVERRAQAEVLARALRRG